ncbi:uncharacterized protein LOC144753257 isoform X2 [Lissotriton helveticus]
MVEAGGKKRISKNRGPYHKHLILESMETTKMLTPILGILDKNIILSNAIGDKPGVQDECSQSKKTGTPTYDFDEEAYEELHTSGHQNEYADERENSFDPEDNEIGFEAQDFTENIVNNIAIVNEGESNISEKHEIQEDNFLFKGSQHTVQAVLLLIICFAVRFRISDEALGALLDLICCILPVPNKMINSLFKFKMFMKKYIIIPKIRNYCSSCYESISDNAKICTNTHCLKDLTEPGAVAFFVQHSIIEQLNTMFKRRDFTEEVRTDRYEHYKQNGNSVIGDVYDGIGYKNLFDKGILSMNNNISFVLNTDGVNIFKSSKLSM